MLLPHTDSAGVIAVADKLRLAIENLQFEVGQHLVPVTISLGAASFSPTKSDSPDAFIKQVDDALYMAKQNGRNRVSTVPSVLGPAYIGSATATKVGRFGLGPANDVAGAWQVRSVSRQE